MDQRRAFALKVLGTLEFRRLCQEERRSAIELSTDGAALGGPKREVYLAETKVFLTSSLAGWQVGLQGTEKGQMEVWFGRLLLGHFDPLTCSFLQSATSPQTLETKN
jgi:hypothetical protein